MDADWSGTNITMREVQDCIDKLLYLSQIVRMVEMRYRKNDTYEVERDELLQADDAWRAIRHIHNDMTLRIAKIKP